MLIIRSDVPEYKCVKRDHHIGIRHLCKITYCRILFTTEKKLTEIWGSSSLLPRFCNLSHEFPKPLAIINTRILVFAEDDIISYEKKRKELTDANQKHWITHGRFKYFLKHQNSR